MSRRALLGGLVSAGSALALGGCAGLGATGARFDASSLSVDPTWLVTTTRKPVNAGRTKPWFGPERATTMTVARAKLVAPDESHLPANVEASVAKRQGDAPGRYALRIAANISRRRLSRQRMKHREHRR